MTDAASLDAGRSVLDRVFGLVRTLVGTVLGWIQWLVIISVALALVNAGLFLYSQRDESRLAIALVVLAVLLLPALSLATLGRRFARFRDGVATVGERLPELTSLPRSVVDGFAEVAPSLESTTRRRLPGRLIGTARALARVGALVRSTIGQHKELLSASATVVQYGPRDVLLAIYGVVGMAVLGLLVPVLALYALVTI
ncbi:hypothetical protein [Actinospongicola halichondriae]|uniref:hypothetical protein n=1 Tax=Actinospongicola halichondriae TaxID=3236844 RepID=UPI003D565E6C